MFVQILHKAAHVFLVRWQQTYIVYTYIQIYTYVTFLFFLLARSPQKMHTNRQQKMHATRPDGASQCGALWRVEVLWVGGLVGSGNNSPTIATWSMKSWLVTRDPYKNLFESPNITGIVFQAKAFEGWTCHWLIVEISYDHRDSLFREPLRNT